MHLTGPAIVLLLTGWLLAGCSTLPAGKPPVGAITHNPAGNETLSDREAVSRLATEITALKLSGQLGAVSGIRIVGEPLGLLQAAARELTSPESGFPLEPQGVLLMLKGTRQKNHQVQISILIGHREIGRLGICLR